MIVLFVTIIIIVIVFYPANIVNISAVFSHQGFSHNVVYEPSYVYSRTRKTRTQHHYY